MQNKIDFVPRRKTLNYLFFLLTSVNSQNLSPEMLIDFLLILKIKIILDIMANLKLYTVIEKAVRY